jgi:hypothetical protein
LENFSAAPNFWYEEGIILIDNRLKCQNINTEFCSSPLVKLKDISKEKLRGNFTKVVLFLHDIAPSTQLLATQRKRAYLRFQYLYHPPYYPDLTPSDYQLFSGLKKNQFKVTIFSPTRRSLLPRGPIRTDKLPNFFQWLVNIEQRKKKCIELRGEYFESIPILFAVACSLPGHAKNLTSHNHTHCSEAKICGIFGSRS